MKVCSIRTLAALSAMSLTTFVNSAFAQTVVRQPYLQMLTPTSVYVVWTTDLATDSRVRFGDDPLNLTQAVTLGSLVTQHEVRLENLTPNTRYYYSVGTSSGDLAGGDATFYFETAPAVGTRKKFRAWIVGDSGYDAPAPRQVRDAMLSVVGAYRPQLFLHLGDMAYNSGTTEEFTNNFFGNYPTILRNTVVWPTFGNHEGISADSQIQEGPYYTAYVLPTAGQAGGLPSGTEAYYSFDYANVHFIVLDTYGTPLNPGGAMLTWLQADLASTTQDWTVAFFHYPPYTKGSHDSDVDYFETEVRQNVVPILEAGGVDLVLSGHSHIYERSYLLNGAYDTPTTAAGHILDAGDGKPLGSGPYLKLSGNHGNDGSVYVVAGHGAYAGGPGNHPVMYFSEAQSGSCLLDVQDNRLAVTNIRYDGAISDNFAMIKGPGLVIATPNGGERLPVGGSATIRWATSGNIPAVHIESSLDDGASWTMVASAVANTGRFNWTLPSVNSTRALVRVSDASNPTVFDESDAGFTLQSVPATAIFFGDYWTYDDRGIDHGTAWRSLAFDDSGWQAGAGQLGFGDGDEATVLYRATPSYPTAYFRKIIPIHGPVSQATLKVRHDDGVVVWVNGNLVASRYAGATGYADFAAGSSLDNETTTVTLTGAPFVVGSNIIAAMVKQSDPSSTDLSFDMELTLSMASSGGTGGGGSSSSSTSSSAASSSAASSSAASSSAASSSAASSSSASSSSTTSGSTTAAGGPGGAQAGGPPVCVTFQRGTYGATRDATIWQGTPGYLDGASTSLYTGTGTEGYRAALLWFDLSSMPSDALVSTATLTLNQGYKTTASTVRAHEALDPWTETGVNWTNYNGGWDPQAIASFVSGDGSGDRTMNLTGLVQDWVSGSPNYGIVLEEDPVVRTQIRSSEEATVSRRPRLEICYSIPAAPPPPTGVIGDQIWSDDDGDGAQDAQEAGLGGISINLYADIACSGSSTLTATQVTDANGRYSFSSLPAGCYNVVVNHSTVPAGYTLTSIRSSVALTLSDGQSFLSADFGYRPPPPPATAVIGDRVWSDDNGDGAQDAGEPGLVGVSVDLYRDASCSGSYALSGTELTDTSGLYRFGSLPAGCYAVAVNGATVPTGYVLSSGSASRVVTLAAAQSVTDADFGYRRLHPALGIATTVSLDGLCPGQEVVHVRTGTGVTSCYLVTNVGEVPVGNIVVTDGTGAVPGGGVSLAPGASQLFSRTGPALASAAVLASASGVDAWMGTTVSTGTDGATVDAVSPGLRLDVTVGANGACPGQDALSVPWGASVVDCYALTNTGDDLLTEVDLRDQLGGLIGSVANLAPGATITLAAPAFTASVSSTVAGRAIGVDAYGFEVSHDDSASLTVLVADPSLRLAAPGSVTTNTCAQVPYTITVTNEGQAPSAPTVTDALPASLSFVSATSPGGPCTNVSGSISCALASLAPGASTTINLLAIPLATSGAVTNTAALTSATLDGNEANNSGSVTTQLVAPTLAGWESISSSFNSTSISAGRTIWFTSVLRPSGLPTTGATVVRAATGHITFSAGGTSYDVLVPGAEVTFDAAITTASTTFDTARNRWVTRAPRSFSGNALLTAVAFPVQVGLPGSVSGVRWAQHVAASRSGIGVSHAWSAAVYSSFSTNYNALNVRVLDGSVAADRAGTPTAFRASLVAGARSSGGTNYVGTLSPTASGTAAVEICN